MLEIKPTTVTKAKHLYYRHITANGKTQHLAAWARETDISGNVISDRLNRGWTPEEALEFEERPRKEYSKWGKLIEYNGELKRIDEWAADMNVSPNTIYGRLQRGFTVEEALTAKKGSKLEDLEVTKKRQKLKEELHIYKETL